MGDRCYFQLTCLAKDAPLFEPLGFYAEESDDGTVDMIDLERNEADTDALPKDVPYFGYHCAGGCYGSGVFACDGSEFARCESDHDGYPTARVNGDGEVDEKTLNEARTYVEVRARAEAMLLQTANVGAAGGD
jgi:hypothetical protein